MTPSEFTVRSLTRGGVLAAILTIILVACGGAAPSASNLPVDLPSTAPPATIAFDTLAANLVDLDGSTVQVTGYLLIDGDRAQLCGVLLESYPPQCGAVTFRVLGAVPEPVLDGLDTTGADNPQRVSWGSVVIIGVVDAGGGSPTITIESIRISELP